MTDQVTVSADDVRTVTYVYEIAARAFGAHLGAIPQFGAALEACGRLAAAVSLEQGLMPPDPVSGPRQLAVTYHQMLLDFEAAEFTREEAMAFTLSYFQATATAMALRGPGG